MHLGVAGHADRELRVVALLDLAVHELPAVHRGDLPHEVHGVGVSLGVGHEAALVLRLVAAQRQDVVQAEEVHVDERVLDVVLRQPAADQVGDHLDPVAVLDGGRYAHRAGAPPHDVPLDAAVGPLGLLDALAVEGDVDVGRIEGHQRIDGREDLLHAVAFERGQQLEGEPRAFRCDRFVDYVYDVHVPFFSSSAAYPPGGGCLREGLRCSQMLFGMSFFTCSTSMPRRRA